MKTWSQILKVSWLGLALAFTNANAENLVTNELPNEIVTTIAEVLIEETEDGDLAGAVVYANNDLRNLIVTPEYVREIRDLMDARRNGWEVRLTVEMSLDKDINRTYEVHQVEILSRENKLSTGILSTPAKAFEPIVARDRREVNQRFNAMYHYDSNSYDVNDNCFNRAQYWSRTQQYIEERQGIENSGTDKVFIFFSRAYTSKYNHKWWYHVAPVIYQGNKNNPIVFDSTFIDRPVTLNQWLGSFDQHTDGQCEKINSIEEYYRKSHEPICMYIVVSGFNYIPSDLSRGRNLRNWRCSDFRNVIRDIPAPGAHTFRPGSEWSDDVFDYLFPANCR